MECIHEAVGLLPRGLGGDWGWQTNFTSRDFTAKRITTAAPHPRLNASVPLAPRRGAKQSPRHIYTTDMLHQSTTFRSKARRLYWPDSEQKSTGGDGVFRRRRPRCNRSRFTVCNAGPENQRLANASPRGTTSQELPEMRARVWTLARSAGILCAVSLAGLGFIPVRPGHASLMQVQTCHETLKSGHETLKSCHETLEACHETSETWHETLVRGGERTKEMVVVDRGVAVVDYGEIPFEGSMAVAVEERGSRVEDAAGLESREGGSGWVQLEPTPITVPLNIVALRGSVPMVWLKEFMTLQGKQAKLSVTFMSTLDAIVSDVRSALRQGKATRKSAMAADLITLSDTSLSPAVAAGFVAPIHVEEVDEWVRRLGPRWERLLRLDRSGHPEPAGQVWALPYRWGCTVIAYRKDKLASAGVKAPADWADLWTPRLAGRVGMVDSPREVVGTVLKSLGASYNARDFDRDVPGGREAVLRQFRALRQQVRLFDSEQHLKALAAGDVWVVVGWSSDILPVAQRSPNLAVLAPTSGTSLWADLWAIPATYRVDGNGIGGRTRGPSPLISQWLDFCLQPARSLAFKRHIFSGASPSTLCDPTSSPPHFNTALPSNPEPANGKHSVKAHVKDEGRVPQASVIRRETSRPVGKEGEERIHGGDDGDGVIGGVPERRAYGPSIEGNVVDGIPPDDVMSRSEFLGGLGDDVKKQYKWLMEAALHAEAEEANKSLAERLAKVPLLKRLVL